ncbi:hypothetical protein NJB1907f44_07340 [Mycobacterium marinum]|nr:hypothetical protein MMEU_3233 [Mycobacterium marinum str. Europe]GJO03272.1 hypothetical protein NJB1907f34b_23100 [Mycobacterium marinum]GJO08618.1 hypothetical protein NJB1907E90_23730 [Mycobacterium marinum]GJO08949.1 hypothetical protein NJB1808e29_42250 [Mycobacterium marinum]GJO13869.1 hypothetical protein NJB1907E11_09990 [Mycobacterium marinum]
MHSHVDCDQNGAKQARAGGCRTESTDEASRKRGGEECGERCDEGQRYDANE